MPRRSFDWDFTDPSETNLRLNSYSRQSARPMEPERWFSSDGRRIVMLAANDAMATIPVKNIAKAKKFYGDTLGLKLTSDEMPGGATDKSGRSNIVVYESQFAGNNK